MIKFKQFIAEQKNTHMEHVEDLMFDGGVAGTRRAILFLRDLRDMLSGNSSGSINATVKYDGAPAIFAGTDPRDGKFFVAKKGIFNKNPKVYKTPAQVRADTSGDLQKKLILALRHLSDLNIQGVIQGDFMFAKADLKNETIDGQKYITFHPNTIVYAVPVGTPLAQKINKAKIGIIWHTSYTGTSFETMKASFGQSISDKLTSSSNVWFDDASYRDLSGTATLTAGETARLNELLSSAGTLFRSISAPILNGISQNSELLIHVKTFNNTKVRAGMEISDPVKHTRELVDWLVKKYDAEILSKKTASSKENWREKKKAVLSFFVDNSINDIAKIFEMMTVLAQAKAIIVNKMNSTSNLKTFIKTKNGFRVTGQEGFVAIDKLSGGAVKLVDRMEFSKANFSPDVIKGWQR
jgi:hypothetical protein